MKDQGNDIEGLVITRYFNFPRLLVWKAWSVPTMLKKWWGPKDYTCPVARMDFRIGGKYLFCMRSPKGKNYWSTGIYRQIVPGKIIVNTDSFADSKGNVVPASYYGMESDFPLELQVSLLFEDNGIKTVMTLQHLGLPAGKITGQTKDGWNQSFDKLEQSLS